MKRHVLFVEDDSDDVFLIERAWKNAALANQIHFSSNGKEAIDYISALLNAPPSLPAVIFLDLNMPLMGGLGALQVLRAQPALQTTPIIILTTSENPSDLDAAYKAGANAYVVKPSGLSDFAEMLSSAAGFWLKYNKPSKNSDN